MSDQSIESQMSELGSAAPAILHKAFQKMASDTTFLQQLRQAGDLPAHQQRVIDEQRDLDEKLANLGDFIDGNPVFAGLSVSEQSDLKAQRVAMESYSAILSDRIARFGSAA